MEEEVRKWTEMKDLVINWRKHRTICLSAWLGMFITPTNAQYIMMKRHCETTHKYIDLTIMSTLHSFLPETEMNAENNKILHKLKSFIFILKLKRDTILLAF